MKRGRIGKALFRASGPWLTAFAGLLAVTLILGSLRSRGVIRWPWIWVLAPMWMPVAAVALLLGIEFAALAIWSRD